MFAADALSINPDITVDLLRWGEPKWVTDAFAESLKAGFEARYTENGIRLLLKVHSIHTE